MKTKLLLLTLALHYSLQIQAEPFTLSGLSIIGILTKLGLVTTVSGTTAAAATAAGTTAGIAAGTAAAGTAASAATATAITAAASAGAAAGATAATAATVGTVVLTGKGIAVGAAALTGTGMTLGYMGRKKIEEIRNNLPEKTQEKINILNNEALKKDLENVQKKYTAIEKDLEDTQKDCNGKDKIIEDMNKTFDDFVILLQQHGITIAQLTEQQQAVYKRLQMLRSLHGQQKVRATA